MPFYQYRCDECKIEFEEFRQVCQRYDVNCPSCDLIPHIVIGPAAVHTFQPYYDVSLGQHIKSKDHKKKVADGLGLTNVGDAGYDEAEKEARSNSEHREREESLKGPTEKFMKAWDKAKAMYPTPETD